MRSRLPPFDALRVLALCVRTSNFTKAADALGLSPAAVSQRMRQLEKDLGVILFRRRGPQLIPTDRARSMASKVEVAIGELRAAIDDCRMDRMPLRVTCAPTFAARWLLPRLATYHGLPDANPLVVDASTVFAPPGTFDVAIRFMASPTAGMAAVRLCADRATPLISPRLLGNRRAFAIDDLLRTPLVPDSRWSAWFQCSGHPCVVPRFVATRFATYELEAQAAVQGIGAALLSPVMYADLCQQGVLFAPFSQTVDRAESYWLLWEGNRREPHFVHWIKEQFAHG